MAALVGASACGTADEATEAPTSALCPRARDPRDAQRCSNYSGAALGTLGVLCSLI